MEPAELMTKFVLESASYPVNNLAIELAEYILEDKTLDEFASSLFAANKSIRFICLTNSKGHVLGSAYRRDIKVRLSDEEIEELARPWVLQTLIATGMHETSGELVYLLGTFRQSFVTTIPISYEREERLIIIISFEITVGDPRLMIEEKIMPLIGKNKDYFDCAKSLNKETTTTQ